ncbi:MAG: ABC transporter permease [Sphaerochaetaceae bacterium]|jgi:putative ABC transport system permease protein|nr:ABC transporter permease [Sphaerochaetaceae bacterium]
MTMKLINVAFRNISRNRRRSLLSGIAVAVASMSIVFLFALVQGMKDDMGRNLATYFTGEVRIRNAQYEEYERYNPMHLTVDWESIDRALAQREDVTAYVPRVTFPSAFYVNGGNHPALGLGADFAREAEFQDLESILKEGRIPESGKNEMLIGALLARDLKLALGDKVTIISSTAARGNNAITLEVAGIAAFPVASMNSQYFWIPLDRAQYFLRMDTGVQEVLVKVEEHERKSAAAIKEQLEAATGMQLDVKAYQDISMIYGFIELAQYIYYFIGIFFLLLGSTVIINTTMMVIYERMREIGTLSALGMHGKELTKLFFLEGTVISAIGAFFGVLLGSAITLYLGKFGINFTDALSGIDMEISSVLYPSFSIWTAIIVYIYSVVVSSLATLIPSRKASRIEPVEALRYI